MTEPKRTPLPGSCHCRTTRYILYLTLPHPYSSDNPPPSSFTSNPQEIYRCNCTTCHKMGFLHVNPSNPSKDFILLSPADPDKELGAYQVDAEESGEEGRTKWYFCPKCGVRCFGFKGSGSKSSIDFSSPIYSDLDSATRKLGEVNVWRAKWDGEMENIPYLSVNGVTLDWPEHREGLDLRRLTEEKRVCYFDDLSEPFAKKKEARWGRPHYGGCY